MTVRTTTTRTLTTTPGGLTVLDLKTFLIGLTDEANVSVAVSHGDRPGESGQLTISASVDAE